MSAPALPPGWVSTGKTITGGESLVTFVQNKTTGQNAVFKVPLDTEEEEDMMKQWIIANQIGEAYPNYKGLEKRVTQLTARGTLLTHRAPGEPLRELLSTNKQLPIWPSMVIAVDHLHKLGWAHNDLQQGNIIVDLANRAITIIDFGKAAPNAVEHQYNWDTIMLNTYFEVTHDALAETTVENLPGLWADLLCLYAWKQVLTPTGWSKELLAFNDTIVVNKELADYQDSGRAMARAFEMWMRTSLMSMKFTENPEKETQNVLDFITDNVRGHKLALTDVPQFPTAVMKYLFYDIPKEPSVQPSVPSAQPVPPPQPQRLSTPTLTPGEDVQSVAAAMRLLDLYPGYTEDDLKKAYRKKLTQYHESVLMNKYPNIKSYTPNQQKKIAAALGQKYTVPLVSARDVLLRNLEIQPDISAYQSTTGFASSAPPQTTWNWAPPAPIPIIYGHDFIKWQDPSESFKKRLAEMILGLPKNEPLDYQKAKDHYDRYYRSYSEDFINQFRPPPGKIPPPGYWPHFRVFEQKAMNARYDLDQAITYVFKSQQGRQREPSYKSWFGW